MTKSELIQYLANVILISRIDGKTAYPESQALEIILYDLNSDYDDFSSAEEVIARGYNHITLVGRYSEKVRNLEDMMFVSLADGDLPESERRVIVSIARQLEISQNQINEMLVESRRRVKEIIDSITCPDCEKKTTGDSNFCPNCGRQL